MKELGTYKQRILYYGKSDLNTAIATILKQHPIPDQPKEYSEATRYPEADFTSNQVYFIDYDMVQTNFLWVDNAGLFNAQMLPYVNLYNDYYGNIVFQEIREARGLAYAAGTWIQTPQKKDRSFFTTSYVATQADKLYEATSTLNSLMKNMKEDQRRYGLAKDAIMNRIETERITKTNIFWTYLDNLDKGITTDNRKDIYEKVPGISMADLESIPGKE